MRRYLTVTAVATFLLVSLVGTTAAPIAAQSTEIATEVSTGNPGEVVEDTTVMLSTNGTVNITVKAENASVANVSIEHNTTTNTVSVTVDANGDGTVDMEGQVQAGTETRIDVDTNTDVPASLRLGLRT